MKEAPVRACCGKRHFSVICPDGRVMCQLCFKRVHLYELNVVDGRLEDVCRICASKEK